MTDIDSVRFHVHNMNMIVGDVYNNETYDYSYDQRLENKLNILTNNNEEEYERSYNEDLDVAQESS